MSHVDVKHGDCVVHQYQCNKVHFSFLPNLLPPALCSGWPALCHWPSRARHMSNSVSHDDGARKCPLRSCFPWRTTLSCERKAVWEVQMVLSLMPQHSDHSQGACMYGQCGPFLLRYRWHCKKKKKKRKKGKSLLYKHQKQTHKQRWPSESPIHLFSCWVLVVPGRSRLFPSNDAFMLLGTLFSGNSWNVNGHLSKWYISSSFCFDCIHTKSKLLCSYITVSQALMYSHQS